MNLISCLIRLRKQRLRSRGSKFTRLILIKTLLEQCSDLLWGPYGPVLLSVDAIVVTLTGSTVTGATVTGVTVIGVTTGVIATGVTAGVPTEIRFKISA